MCLDTFPSSNYFLINNHPLSEKKPSAQCTVTHLLLQEKFASLSLAFKTDKQTLEKRMDLHKRARDVAEQNIDKEMTGLKDALKVWKIIKNRRYLNIFHVYI